MIPNGVIGTFVFCGTLQRQKARHVSRQSGDSIKKLDTLLL